MWFLTVDPLIRISVFIAKLSERYCCWRVLEDFHSEESNQFFDIHCGPFMRLHFSSGCCDCRKTTRLRQGPFQQNSSPFCWSYAFDAPESTNSLSSGLRYDASKHLFSEGKKNVALFFSFNFQNTFGQLPRCFAGSLLLPLCLLLRPLHKFWSVGATLMRFTWANKCERRISVSNACVSCNSFREFFTSDRFPHVWALR